MDRQQLERRLLFTPCETKEELGDWIEHFLGYRLPDSTVDADSTSSPLGLIWEIYHEALYVNNPDFEKILAYANRFGFKTLGASALEILMVFHDCRDVIHLAAIEEQSSNCLEYVKKAMRTPAMAPFEVQGDKRAITIQRFRKDGMYYSPKEYAQIPESERYGFEEFYNKIEIIVATPKSLNGKHGAFFCMDETDLLDNEAVIQEADGVPTPTKDSRAKQPIVYMTSTRKKAAGRVQKLINNADREGLEVRHWNIIDTTKACPPSKHSPDQPTEGSYRRLPIYVDDNMLRRATQEEYDQLNEADKAKYTEYSMFEGCVSCPLAPTCKSRLATHQTSKSPLLLDHSFTAKKVTKGNIEFIKSQFLCRKPLATGSIYSRFSREKHFLTAAQIYQRLEQQEPPPGFGKQDLIRYFKSHPLVRFYGGMDFGYTHLFVAIILAKVGQTWFVLECFAATELETMDLIEIIKKSFGHYNAEWYPDPENKQLIQTLKKSGVHCVDFSKKAGSVLEGIDAVRAKLSPGPEVDPHLYFLAGDPSMDADEDSLAEALEKWSWKLNAAGEPTEVPAERYKDFLDALRYPIFNISPVKSNGAKRGRPTNAEVAARPMTVSEQFWSSLRGDGQPLQHLSMSDRPSPEDLANEGPTNNPTAPKTKKRFYY